MLLSKEYKSIIGSSFINSYSQMFFSDNRIFAWLILAATFVNPISGLSGLVSVCVGIWCSLWLGLNKQFIQSGAYTYNSLMVGLVLGLYFKINLSFFILLFLGSMLSVWISKALYIVLSKYDLPPLGLPFILVVWIIVLSSKSAIGLQASDSNLFFLNNLYWLGGVQLVNLYEGFTSIHIPSPLRSYFQSLGAIYFQYNVIAGILIALGLLIYSRIAFVLSIVGFLIAYYTGIFLYGPSASVNYTYIGFNFILAAISIGGFYLVPSRKSFLLAILSVCAITVVNAAFAYFLSFWQLPLYSLPGTFVVLSVLLLLKYRLTSHGLHLVTHQLFSPEKNYYSFHYYSERYKNENSIHIHPPFYGFWYVSQGYDGGITHLDEWKHALDFVITDEMKKTFKLPGQELSDFFCYNVPVLSPADGIVTEVLDGIPDNPIGEVNLEHNWGNTIIIKHADGLFSKLSHLTIGSIAVSPGTYVKKGDYLGTCGNSGRSPEPHIHFQLQSTPWIGSKTLPYPLSYYVLYQNSKYTFHSFSIPNERATISGVYPMPLLQKSLSFVPGQSIHWEVVSEIENQVSPKTIESWSVHTDAYNQLYFLDEKSKATAYFATNGTLFYFTQFYGDKQSFLYKCYINMHKLILSFYQDMEILDLVPIDGLYNGAWKIAQDFLALSHLFLKSQYTLKCVKTDDVYNPSAVVFHTQTNVTIHKQVKQHSSAVITFDQEKLNSITIQSLNETCKAKHL